MLGTKLPLLSPSPHALPPAQLRVRSLSPPSGPRRAVATLTIEAEPLVDPPPCATRAPRSVRGVCGATPSRAPGPAAEACPRPVLLPELLAGDSAAAVGTAGDGAEPWTGHAAACRHRAPAAHRLALAHRALLASCLSRRGRLPWSVGGIAQAERARGSSRPGPPAQPRRGQPPLTSPPDDATLQPGGCTPQAPAPPGSRGSAPSTA